MKKTLLIIILSITMLPEIVHAQSKHGVENYNMVTPGEAYLWVPVIHFTGRKNFYAEARYNYEDVNTASVYAGKNFEGGKKINYTITPMAGVVFGKYNGVSLAANTTLDYKLLSFATQMQYTINNSGMEENFFYNWCEGSYQFFKNFYAGASMQQTKTNGISMFTQSGLLIGFKAGKITVPLYIFSPFNKQRQYIAGLIFEWD